MWMAIASTVASMLMKAEAENQVEKQRSQTMAMERQRQEALQQRARASLDQVKPQFTPEAQEDRVDDLAKEREKVITPDLPADYGSTVATQPTEVKSEIARQMVNAIQKGRQSSQALARLGGYGDASAMNAINLSRSGSDLKQIGGFSQGSNSLLGMELQGANNAGSTMRGLGEVAGGLGNIAMMYSMYGGKGTQPPAPVEEKGRPAGRSYPYGYT